MTEVCGGEQTLFRGQYQDSGYWAKVATLISTMIILYFGRKKMDGENHSRQCRLRRGPGVFMDCKSNISCP